MSSYKLEKLGEVCDFIGGSQPPKAKFIYDLSVVNEHEYVRLIQIRDYKSDKHVVYIPKNSTKKFCIKEDVMIGRYGPPVFQILDGLEGAYNVALMKAVPKAEVLDRDFLFRFLESPMVQSYIIKLSERAAGQTGVNKQALHDYPIPIPSLDEQKRIVSTIDKVLVDIEQARSKVEQNLKNARELFESYLQGVFSEDWEVRPLESISTIVNGYAFKSGDFSPNNEIKSIKITNVGVYEFIEEKQNYLPKKYLDEYNQYIANDGDVVIALTRTIISSGLKVAVVPPSYNGALINQRVAAVHVNEEIMPKEMLQTFLSTKMAISYVRSNVNELMQPNLSIKDLKAFPIPVPPADNVSSICRKLLQMKEQKHELVSVYTAKLEALDELKKSILQRAFSGELTKDSKGVAA